VQARDEDLRSHRFFDAATFPQLALHGERGEYAGGLRGGVDVDLTIRNVTHRTPLAIDVRGMTLDGQDRAKAALTATTAINRSDFGLTTELREESGGSGGPDVHVTADIVVFLRQ